MNDEERKMKQREILNIYKFQIAEKAQKSQKRTNHKKLVERVLAQKQSEMSFNQMSEERRNDLKKKSKQKEELDRQIELNRKLNVEELIPVYV